MIEHLRSLLAIDDFVVLSAADTANVGRYSSVDDYVVFDIVLVWLETSEDEKTAAGLKFFGVLSQSGSEFRQLKCFLIDVANRLF